MNRLELGTDGMVDRFEASSWARRGRQRGLVLCEDGESAATNSGNASERSSAPCDGVDGAELVGGVARAVSKKNGVNAC